LGWLIFQLVAATDANCPISIVLVWGMGEAERFALYGGGTAKHLDLRIRAAHYWVERYAIMRKKKRRLQGNFACSERLELSSGLQRAFLTIPCFLCCHKTNWEGDALQVAIFNAGTAHTHRLIPESFSSNLSRFCSTGPMAERRGNFSVRSGSAIS
jgi:hypothetical protein